MISIINHSLSACVFIPDVREDELYVLCTNRKEDHSRWSLPGGKVEDGESAAVAAARELEEETGVFLRPEDLAPIYTSADGQGYLCTTFLGGSLIFSHNQQRSPFPRDYPFSPEKGLKVEWKPFRWLMRSENSPFHNYYQGMYGKLSLQYI